MKKAVIMMILSTVIGLSASVASGDTGLYFGIGGSYAYNFFDTENDFDNPFGLNAHFGYRINDSLLVEYNYDSLQGFDWSQTQTVGFAEVTSRQEIDIKTHTILAKYSFDKSDVRPYLSGGVGILDSTLSSSSTSTSFLGTFQLSSSEDSKSDICIRLGAGIDFFPRSFFSVGIDLSYFMGLDDSDDIKYLNVLAGVSYYF